MPLQLKIIAIVLAVIFFVYTVYLVRTDKAEIRQLRKWLLFSLIILAGSLVPDLARRIAHFFGVKTLTDFALFSVSGIIIIFLLRMQLSLIVAERQIKALIQEVSILKKEVSDSKKKEKLVHTDDSK